jgi:hypothetical protein
MLTPTRNAFWLISPFHLCRHALFFTKIIRRDYTRLQRSLSNAIWLRQNNSCFPPPITTTPKVAKEKDVAQISLARPVRSVGTTNISPLEGIDRRGQPAEPMTRHPPWSKCLFDAYRICVLPYPWEDKYWLTIRTAIDAYTIFWPAVLIRGPTILAIRQTRSNMP